MGNNRKKRGKSVDWDKGFAVVGNDDTSYVAYLDEDRELEVTRETGDDGNLPNENEENGMTEARNTDSNGSQ